MQGDMQTGFSGGTIAFSTKQAGESDADFVDRHCDEACLGGERATTTLVTNWVCGGANEQVSSTRNTGETYIQFWDRHAQAVKDAAEDCPPD